MKFRYSLQVSAAALAAFGLGVAALDTACAQAGAAPSRERLEEGLRSLVSILAGSPASSRSPV